ncbi:hypothetical protein [Umezawaea sp. Da 62-37]|uniref:hypothetical protein n=1 Tax=Umezawaea sp. Da 62-37 TaxID=3075927 RepID=UPI0028F6FCDB|nr:hypothetical protein [Umezawaea sp. Da 62-37]WNV85283.1 hypothetical protein RM788_45390 [Umezawaea sp. Da 62-37]
MMEMGGGVVMIGLALHGLDQAQFPVHAPVVPPVDVLGDGDLDVVDAMLDCVN